MGELVQVRRRAQVTLLRAVLHIEEGDSLALEVRGDTIVLRKNTSQGLASPVSRGLSEWGVPVPPALGPSRVHRCGQPEEVVLCPSIRRGPRSLLKETGI